MACQGRSSANVRTLAVLLCVMVLAQSAHAALYTVGGSKGWGFNVKYSPITVRVGDTILFKYQKNAHDVLRVSYNDYPSCTTSRATAKYTSGADYIKLTKKGTYNFVCGYTGHCKAGMKITVYVK